MSLRRTLEENVFGPFDANEALDEYVTHQKGTPVDLHGLEVTRNSRESGLDESESSISDSSGKFRYFGILHIEDLSWVSPTGRRLIQEDMKSRGINLTLESIYGPDRPYDGLTVKIGITITSVHDKSGSKYMGLTYLLDRKYSTDMILFSPTTGMSTRRFRIVSFDPMCFVKSQKYLAAYRFFRVLSDLCLGIPKPTPEDFFNAYISHHEEAGMSVRRDAVLQLMSRHAKWLVGEAKRYVNVQSWKDFARTGTLDIDEESDVQMDEVDNGLLTRPVPSSPAALSLSPGRKRLRSVGSRSSLEYTSEESPNTGYKHESSPERSPSPPFTNPYVAVRVPVAFRFVPGVPDDFHWWCEVEECHYNIDMLNLTRENLAMLDGETVAKLRLQDWSLSDPWVRLAFKAMVEDHRAKHLESWGLRCLKGPSGALEHIELAEPPGPDKEKDKFSCIKIEFVNLLDSL